MKKDVIKKIKRIVGFVVVFTMLFSVNIAAAQNSSDLEVETKNEIREDYLEFYKLENPDSSLAQAMTIDDIMILDYYGNHGGYEIVEMWFKDMPCPDANVDMEIGGYVFSVNMGRLDHYFYTYKDSEFVLIKDAYAQGLLSKEEIYNISIVRGGIVLSSQLAKIKEDYLKIYKTENPDSSSAQAMTIDDIVIKKYYGVYNGYDIVQIYFKDQQMSFDEYIHRIGEYQFITNSSLAPYFYAYKDGTFTHVKDAYAAGMLTDKDIYLIAKSEEEQIASWKDPFTDVAKGDWYYKSVEYAYAYNLFAGLTETAFGPNEEMTRAMLATVLWRYAGSPDGSQNVFTDVPEDTWYTDAVAWAAEQGLVYGISDGIYAPEEKITREQLAAIFYRYAKKVNDKELDADGMAGQYADVEEISPWAHESVSWANGRGILSGRDIDGVIYIAPAGNATRAEVASMIMRFIQYLE